VWNITIRYHTTVHVKWYLALSKKHNLLILHPKTLKANKFVGVENPKAYDCVEKIRTARSPEEAALIGRSTLRQKPELV
jgi:diaminohydroxyphosphoribosylaminopyrimidine deaminase/5-amino-6-(5-phosphoribosylamino)uracil reductase